MTDNERLLNAHNCKGCGEIFFTYGKSKRQLCDKCKRRNLKELKHRQREILKSVYVTEKGEQTEAKSINEIMRELAEYNKAHNTALTYGQYSLLLVKGDIENESKNK